jgi:ubiquinone/menaquinone biosynthesis C-methylase UbiE
MEITDAIQLIQGAADTAGSPVTWADLGSGSGLFTYALSTLLPRGSRIYAVDQRPGVLHQKVIPEGIQVVSLQKDFVKDALGLKNLQGLLMANSLHYVADQSAFVREAGTWLQPGGRFLIVEYDSDKANPWVPYPLSFTKLQRLFGDAGYSSVRKLGQRPSIFGRASIYAALIQ